MNFLRSWLRRGVNRFLAWLYTRGAWAYDLVAGLVSLGRWNAWVRGMALWPEAEPGMWVLELGFGPGYLQAELARQGFRAAGVDLSPYMARRARRHLQARHLPVRLVLARAQGLPFPDETFHRVVATFPTEYILDPHTLREVARVLRPGGRLDVLLSVSSVFLDLAERVLGGEPWEQERRAWEARFSPLCQAGLTFILQEYTLARGGRGWVLTAWKSATSKAHSSFQEGRS